MFVFASTCPHDAVMMAKFDYTTQSGRTTVLACESFPAGGAHDGAIQFISVDGSTDFPLSLMKRTASNLPRGGNDTVYYDNMSKAEVLSAPTDIMGARALSSGDDPTLDDVATAIPPIRGIRSARVWVASRGSGVDATLDEDASNWLNVAPSPSVVRRL